MSIKEIVVELPREVATERLFKPIETKVIGFDSWTGGAISFQRLVEPLKKRGVRLELIHIGSWGGDKGRPAEEMLGNLPVRDVSYYKGKDFLEILDIEQPAMVLFLSTQTFAHRAFLRYCRLRGIPTLHQYHGLVRVQSVDHGNAYKVNLVSQFWFVVTRLIKSLTKIWPNYAYALWKTNAPLNEWVRFIQDIISLAMGKYIPVASADAKTDVGCVYVEADVEHAVKKYGFSRDEVYVVGNPDLVQFGLTSDLIGLCLMKPTNEHIDIIYIDTGLIYAGLVFDDSLDFLQHLLLTKTQLEEQGRKLVVKLHPHHSLTSFPALLQEKGIEICSNEEFVPRLKKCCAAIVEPSTAAMIPALMGIPLLLAKYGKLSGQRYGEVLSNYPRAYDLVDLNKFNVLLAEGQQLYNSTLVKAWIAENVGPLPSDLMPERIAKIISEKVCAKR